MTSKRRYWALLLFAGIVVGLWIGYVWVDRMTIGKEVYAIVVFAPGTDEQTVNQVAAKLGSPAERTTITSVEWLFEQRLPESAQAFKIDVSRFKKRDVERMLEEARRNPNVLATTYMFST